MTDSEEYDLYNDVFQLSPITFSPEKNKEPNDQTAQASSNKQPEIETLQATIQLLRSELQAKKDLHEKIVKNFHMLLATARHEISRLSDAVKESKAELHAPYKVKCESCQHVFDSSSQRPPRPQYIRVLRPSRVVEVHFYQNETLDQWLLLTGLTINPSDGLPALPEKLLDLENKRRTLTETGSLLVKPEDPKSDDTVRSKEKEKEATVDDPRRRHSERSKEKASESDSKKYNDCPRAKESSSGTRKPSHSDRLREKSPKSHSRTRCYRSPDRSTSDSRRRSSQRPRR